MTTSCIFCGGSMSLPDSAALYARSAHNSINQKRKYTNTPYWLHTEEVAELVATVTSDENTIVAAYLHDVLEDVAPLDDARLFQKENISRLFGDKVLFLVEELTDVFTKKAYPGVNRFDRKRYEARRLGAVSAEAQNIKLADIISNSKDIILFDPSFSKVYIKEQEHLLSLLTRGNDKLYSLAFHIIKRGLILLEKIV